MLSARLPEALESGLLEWPDAGEILVFAPDEGAQLAEIPTERVRIIEAFRPGYEIWKNRGFRVAATAREEAQRDTGAAVIGMPRSKTLARAWVSEAAGLTAGPIVIDGQKNAGIDSFLKACKARVPVSTAVSRAHGKLFVLLPDPGRAEALAGWAAKKTTGPDGFVTAPGVFSEGKIDKGSQLLASVLPVDLAGRGADLGAGWGWLSAQVLQSEAVTSLDLIEADQTAIECARDNIRDPRAAFHWADVRRFTPDRRFDFIVTNPPFHTSRAADPTLGQAFIRQAAKMLSPRGTLWLVANRGLPYEAVIQENFRTVEVLSNAQGFKVLKARNPASGRKSASDHREARRSSRT